MKKIPFGHCIYEFHCDPELTKKSYDYMLNSDVHWDSTISGDKSSSDYGYMDAAKTIPYYDEELFNWIQTCLDEIIADQETMAKLEICDSWLTRTNFAQGRTHPHQHPNSVLSGIFYYTSHARTKTLFYKINSVADLVERMFFHGRSNPVFGPNFANSNQNYSSISEAGKLVIFPSNILHSISSHTDTKLTRYTMAFNTFPTGSVLSDSSSARLTLNVKSSREKYLEYLSQKGETND